MCQEDPSRVQSLANVVQFPGKGFTKNGWSSALNFSSLVLKPVVFNLSGAVVRIRIGHTCS